MATRFAAFLPKPIVVGVSVFRRHHLQFAFLTELINSNGDQIMRKTLLAVAMLALPSALSASTAVVEGGGPYDILSDTLFTGVATTGLGGAGTYTVDFVGDDAWANAEAAVTIADIGVVFNDLTVTWLGAETPVTLVIAAGLTDLATVFSAGFNAQSLQFEWTDSDAGAGFGFDVTTAPIPLPASALLLFGAVGGLGAMRRNRKSA